MYYDDAYFESVRQKPLDPELLLKMTTENPKRYNQQAGPDELMTSGASAGVYALNKAAQDILKAATRQLQFTPRNYFDCLKLARTIADLSGDKFIQASHLAEAIQYRRKG